MGLADKLEALFNVETEATIESAVMELVTAGENIGQKTVIPFSQSIMATAFALELAEDIDDEFADVAEVINKARGIPLEIKKGVKNPDTVTFSSTLPAVIYSSMKLMPSDKGESRKALERVIIKLREDSMSYRKPKDSLSEISNILNR